MSDKLKRAQIKELPTETLRKIVSEHPYQRSTPEKPLAGHVQIEGIGQVPVLWLQDELADRGE